LLHEKATLFFEHLSFKPAIEALSSQKCSLKILPLLSEENLFLWEKAFEEVKGEKFLYLTPLCHYPTTRSMSTVMRQNIYKLAQKYQIVIIEDDYCHEFQYGLENLLPLASSDSEGRVIYVGTFSKSLFPSLRVGFLVLPQGCLEPFLFHKKIISRQNNTFVQEALACWIESQEYFSHLQRYQRELRKRRNFLFHALEQMDPFVSHLFLPYAGTALWCETLFESSSLEKYCKENFKLALNSQEKYDFYQQRSFGIRLSFSKCHEEELEKAMILLGKAFQWLYHNKGC